MIYMRGAAADYDEWAKLTGDPSWSYEHVLPLFRRMEDNARGADRFHGVGGPLRVEDLRSPHPWTRAVVQSAVAAGYPRNDDFNGATQEGVGQYQVTQKRGRRWSSADAYLHPAEDRPNLTVRTGALTTRVLVEGGRATGVEYRAGGRVHTARATREVVLSGGAINSPQLLMLSGIGPADHLREVGVDVVHDLPGVGGGLQDHPLVPVVWNVRSGKSLFRAESPSGYAKWFGARRGPLTSNLAEAGLFTRSNAGAARARPADALPAGEVLEAGRGRPRRRRVHRRGRAGARALARLGAAALGRPDAGRRPSTPATSPTSATSTPWSAAVEQAREIASGGPLASVLADEWSPGGTVRGRDALRASVRDTLESLYHPVSAPAGWAPTTQAVVDSQMRVRGIEGLRIVDASVMPTLVRGNTNAPTIMLGERAADLILGRAVDPELTPAG